MMKALIFAAAAVLSTVAVAPAQDAAAEGRPDRRPVPPLIAALDANKDGVIDADEIAKSPEALKSLDKDADGKLSREEVAPGRGGKRGERGERGEGRKRGPKPDAAQ